MAVQKPSKPDVTLPDNFGGTKTPYTDSQISNGYQEAVPQVVDGGNINYEKDAVFKYLKYLKTVADVLTDMPIGKFLTVDSNNKFEYADKPEVPDLSSYQLISNLSQTVDASTKNYPSNKAVVDFIGTVYPVGSLFFSTATTCPLQVLGIGTWQKVGTSLTLGVNTSVPVKGTGMTLGLTDGSKKYGLADTSSSILGWSPLISNDKVYGTSVGNTTDGWRKNRVSSIGVTTDSTKSGIVGTVTRTQITVNVFQRIS